MYFDGISKFAVFYEKIDGIILNQKLSKCTVAIFCLKEEFHIAHTNMSNFRN